MKNHRPFTRRLDVEELETRVVPSTSGNWSGYAIATNPGAVTAVKGSWVVPTVSGTGTSYSSAWVGIDGDTSNSVEQIGTDSDLTNGKPTYYAWYEMYPAGSVNLNLKIKPGDVITAEVSYIGSNRFTLHITDGSQSFSITKKEAGAQRSSAEWIQEAPSSGIGVLPLSNFGTIHFSKAQATICGTTGPIDYSAWSSKIDEINMVNNAGATKATTGGLTDSGSPLTSSFSVSYVATGNSSTGTGSHHTGGGGGGGWGWRQTNLPVMLASNPVPTNVSRVAAAQTTPAMQTGLTFSPLLPFAFSPSFGGGTGTTGNTMSLISFLGGMAEQILVLPAMLPVNELPATDASPDSSAPNTVLLLPMPTPQDQPRQTRATSKSRTWTAVPEPTPAVSDQPEEERTAAAHPSDLVFGLFLAGALVMTRERGNDEKRGTEREIVL